MNAPTSMGGYREAAASVVRDWIFVTGERASASPLTPRDRVRLIVAEVAFKNGLTFEQIMRRSSSPKIAHPKHEAFYELRRRTDLSYPRIAAFFGMDHTSVIYGEAKHEDRISAAPKARAA